MEIKINLTETATELAHKEVEKELKYDAKEIYFKVSDTKTEYTDQAQRLFEKYYDYFLTILCEFKIN